MIFRILIIDFQTFIKQYASRFQIEFLYRDAKQNTGLNDGQSRSKEKIYFQTNIALTTINVAKIFHWFNSNKTEQETFSMRNIKTLYNNQFWIDIIFLKFQIRPNSKKINP